MMPLTATIFAGCICLLASAWAIPTSGQTLVTIPSLQEAEFTQLRGEDGTTIPALRGVWRVPGYGFLVEVTPRGANLYSETRAGTWRHAADALPEDLIVRFDQAHDFAHFSFHPRVPPFVARRIERMPSTYVADTHWSPSKIFDVFAATMAENYAFFEERSCDWEKRVANCRQRLNDAVSETELFDAMRDALEGLEDAHLHLVAEIDGELRGTDLGQPETLKRTRAAFDAQDKFDTFEQFMSERRSSFRAGIRDVVLRGKSTTTCKRLVWGRTPEGLGYLFIPGMGDFSDSEDLDEELATLHKGLNEILTQLADAPAMIVDVCSNGGGMDIYSIAIANHFADRKRLAFSKSPRHAPEIKHEIYVEPYVGRDEDGVTFTKPVYLVINDITVSAAEIFVLCMKDLPHVTLVGQTTRGALSDVLEKTLPNGWEFGLSNEVYRDNQGICYEARGIAPEIPMSVLDPALPDLGHAAAIAKIAELHRVE